MHLDLRLNDLPMPRIATIRLEGPTRILQEITNRNLVKATQGVESRQFQNRKEKMKQRLMDFPMARDPMRSINLTSLNNHLRTSTHSQCTYRTNH